MGERRKLERHKWVNDRNGKHCKKCFSSIGTRAGTIKYVERDEFGFLNAVNWYPRCFPELPNRDLQSGKSTKESNKKIITKNIKQKVVKNGKG